MIAECICGARKEFGPGDSGPIWWLIEHRKTHRIWLVEPARRTA